MFSKNLRYLREKYELTQADLAKRLGKSESIVSHWEKGISMPRAKVLDSMSTIFHVGIDDLMYRDLAAETVNMESLTIPVYGSVPAGIPTEAIDDIVDVESIPLNWTTGGRAYFGVKVKGDSMSPKYLDGDTIICRKQSTCESGQDCIVYVNGYDATLKRVLFQDAMIVLQPLNPAYEAKVYHDVPITIAGVVVEIRRTV